MFGGEAGNDIITDFDVKTDVISFAFQVFQADGTFAGVLSHSQQVGTSVVISYPDWDGGTSTLTLSGIKLSALRADDFLFGT